MPEPILHYLPEVGPNIVEVLFLRVPASRLDCLQVPIVAAIKAGAETVVCYELRREADGTVTAKNLNKRVSGDLQTVADAMRAESGDFMVCVIGHRDSFRAATAAASSASRPSRPPLLAVA